MHAALSASAELTSGVACNNLILFYSDKIQTDIHIFILLKGTNLILSLEFVSLGFLPGRKKNTVTSQAHCVNLNNAEPWQEKRQKHNSVKTLLFPNLYNLSSKS